MALSPVIQITERVYKINTAYFYTKKPMNTKDILYAIFKTANLQKKLHRIHPKKLRSANGLSIGAWAGG